MDPRVNGCEGTHETGRKSGFDHRRHLGNRQRHGDSLCPRRRLGRHYRAQSRAGRGGGRGDAGRIGGDALFIRSDVRLAADCRDAVEQTLERFGKIDILFNNAGVFHPKTLPECTEEEWDETIDSSLKGAFLMSKYTLPSMIEQGSGSIIHTSSGWGILGGSGAASYCAAKGGLIVMAKAMAIDHGPQGIRVNCVCPGTC